MGVSNRACTGHHAVAALRAALQSRATDAAGYARELDRLGFIIVPKPYQKPARRGNAVDKRRLKDIDPWIGKSHTANLIGG